jgi:hypothetical protein
MPCRQQFDLSTFDNQLLDGLDFCRKVYDLFDQVRDGPEGVAKLRLRPTKKEKRLIEELIPVARYVQARYREGRRIKVRWFSGSQPYDAILWSSGWLVKHHMAPRRLCVEVTTSVHPNAHLVRKLLQDGRVSFGVKGISKDKKGAIVSTPHVYRNDEHAVDIAKQILKQIESKSKKCYPPGTVLIINCVSDGLILDFEWNAAVERVRASKTQLPFREVFLLESSNAYSATLYGNKEHGRRRKRNDS